MAAVVDEIDISTYTIAEAVVRAFDSRIKVEDVMRIWYGVGDVVKAKLAQQKAVKLTSLGTFTLSSKTGPIFIIAPDLANQCKLKQTVDTRNVDKIPVTFFNFMQLSTDINVKRETVEKIYNKFVEIMKKKLIEGRNVSLNIKNVAEISINGGFVNPTFTPDFLTIFFPQDPSLIKKPEVKRAERGPNPITGERYEEQEDVKLRPRARNPMFDNDDSDTNAKNNRVTEYYAGTPASDIGSKSSMDTMSLLHSPRSVTPIDRKNKSAPVAIGRRASSAKQEIFNNRTTDARILAAKALEPASKKPSSAADIKPVLEKIKQKVIERGGANGIKGLIKVLAIMDNNGDKKIGKEELKYGLRDYGIAVTEDELHALFVYFDRDKSGTIDVDEFLIGLRGDMNERRTKMVKMAFNILDKDKSGTVTVDDLVDVYDVTANPDVKSGKITAKEAMKQFMLQWDRIDIDGIVTFAEFLDYYRGISASIDGDDYFELMIRNAWRIAGGEGFAANTANKRVLVTNKDGTQRVETINQELGLKAGDREEIRRRLAVQGVNAEGIELYGGYEDKKSAAPNAKNPFAGRPQQASKAAAPAANVFGRAVAAAQDLPMMDQSAPADYSAPSTKLKREAKEVIPAKPEVLTPIQLLQKLLYTPPISFELLGAKLQCSVVTANPRLAQGAFFARLQALDNTLSKMQLMEMWKLIDPRNVGSIELNALYSLFAERLGKDKSVTQNAPVLDRVKSKIMSRSGGGGIKGLQKTLAIMDNNGDKKIGKEELKYGLRDYGVDLNLRELDDLFNYFDRDKSGTIDVDEFLIGLRGDMNERRTKMVKMAFNILDKDKSGTVTVDDLVDVYDVTANPDVKSGKITKQEAMKQFMLQWDRIDIDGIVTFDEFVDYYRGVSASIDGDDYFELMIRNAWRIAGGEGFAANTANKRVLVTNKDGTQRVETINQELGLKAGDREEIRRRLAVQGVNAEGIELYGGYEDKKSAAPNAKNPFAGRGISAKPPQAKAGVAAPVQSKALRNAAAAKLAGVFRMKIAQRVVAQERRKVERVRSEQEEQIAENSRPKAQVVIRPKGKSYIGF